MERRSERGKNLEQEMNHERLWTLGNQWRVLEGKRVGGSDEPGDTLIPIREGTDGMKH